MPPASLLAPQRFRLLNKEAELPLAGGWDCPDQTLLWQFHLHYFDDLVAEDAAQRKNWHLQLVNHWIVHNPPGQGPGWHPYTISRRTVNWLKWDLATGNLTEPMLQSVVLQIRWLMQRLEYHLLGNHLLANAKALVFAGCYFAGTEADTWLAKGLALLQDQLAEQILPDGGHVERSPMYHAIILEDLLDLINLSRVFPEQLCPVCLSWQERVSAMMSWLYAMKHPDGAIALFNDSNLNGAAAPEALLRYMKRLGLPGDKLPENGLTVLAASGYIRWADQQATLIMDCAPVGPDYQPGHGHADTLSFELSLFGQRVVVNSGVSEYGIGKERLRQRGTAAHNTVVVDRQDSSEVWSGFRIARRARPYLYNLSITESSIFMSAGHDGYQRLPGKVIHQRTWQARAGRLLIEDTLLGDFTSAAAYVHIHPAIKLVEIRSTTSWALQLPDGQGITFSVLQGSGDLLPGTWHPDFGSTIENLCFKIEFQKPVIQFELCW